MLSLGILGSFEQSNAVLGKALRDEDLAVRSMAEDALWAIWFRADTPEHNQTLEEVRNAISQSRDLVRISARATQRAEALVTRLIAESPTSPRLTTSGLSSISSRADMSKVLRIASECSTATRFTSGPLRDWQCQLGLNRRRDAIKSLRRALKLRPHNSCAPREHPRAGEADRIRRYRDDSSSAGETE